MSEDFDKLMKEILDGQKQAKEVVLPDDEFVKDEIKFKPPVEFKEGKGKPIDTEDQLDDFKLARDSMHSIIQNGHLALGELLKVAAQSDHPRAFEVVSTLMKTIGESAKDLLKLQEQMIDIRNSMHEHDKPEERGINEEGSFRGTVTDLLEAREAAAKKKNK